MAIDSRATRHRAAAARGRLPWFRRFGPSDPDGLVDPIDQVQIGGAFYEALTPPIVCPPDRLARAAARLTVIRNRVAAQALTYTRLSGGQIAVCATTGSSDYEAVDDASGRIQFRTNDFIVSRSDLVQGGAEFRPAPGDRISRTQDGLNQVFEVLAIDGGNCWRWCDSYQNSIRIHVKELQ